MEIEEHIQGILDTAPTNPGCYLMKDAQGVVIYVGKAINGCALISTPAPKRIAKPEGWCATLRTSNGS